MSQPIDRVKKYCSFGKVLYPQSNTEISNTATKMDLAYILPASFLSSPF